MSGGSAAMKSGLMVLVDMLEDDELEEADDDADDDGLDSPLGRVIA